MAAKFSDKERDIIISQLLKAAYDQILSGSVQSSTISDLSRKANISTGAFYNFFASKEALFFEASIKLNNDLADMSSQLIVSYGDIPPNEKLIKTFLKMMTYMESNNILKFFCDDFPLIERKLAAKDLKYHDTFSEKIVDALVGSGFSFKFNKKTVASLINILIYSLLHKKEIGSHYEQAIEIIISGVCDEIIADTYES